MAHSNSSLSLFMDCQKKYALHYIDKVYIDTDSPHLKFGTMAHDVLYRAGKLRDNGECDFDTVIPSEVAYMELKNFFGIKSWTKYFVPIVKQTFKYEQECMQDLGNGPFTIDREVKLQVTPERLGQLGYKGLTMPVLGIVDCLIHSENYAFILDYKFSANRKDVETMETEPQLSLYAFLVHENYGIPYRNIKIGYIDIPKMDMGVPTVLSNGTLSRAKNQNCTQELYEKAVIAVHGEDDPKYNCKPGGHYYDAWCNMANNKPAYLTYMWLDETISSHIVDDMLNTACMIDYTKEHKLPFLRKCGSFSCGKCDYAEYCRPWKYPNWD